jgi:PPOX class probable F420-dependent enzyme
VTDINDPAVSALLEQPNHAVISTIGKDGSIHTAVVWQEVLDGKISVNSAVGRVWPTNLERDPKATLLIYQQDNPFEYVEIRGTAKGTIEGADEQIDRLAKKYIDQDKYPFRVEGEQRITYSIDAKLVRYQKQ